MSFLPSSLPVYCLPPQITEHPEDTTVVKNEPVTLRCAATSSSSVITWYKDGKRVVTADMDHKVNTGTASGALCQVAVM
jgi:hypothetical protein